MENSQKQRKTPKGLSKIQIQDLCLELNKKLNSECGDVIKTISKIVEDDITMQDEDSPHIVGLFLTPQLIVKYGEKFTELYEQCHVGVFKDRYALLQISWSEWECVCLLCGTPENITMIPDEVSSRQHDKQESCAVSAVFHAVCAAFFEAASAIIKDIRPIGINMPSVPALHRYDNVDVILGFAGACMRLVYKKSDQETKLLIKGLQMTEAMKEFYTECGVLSPGTSSHKTLPVRGLNNYLQFLNKCLIESCTTQAFLLYGKDFVKVCLPNQIRYNQN